MENHDAAISFMSILWNKAGHSAGFKTLYTSQIASDTSDIRHLCLRREMFQDKRK